MMPAGVFPIVQDIEAEVAHLFHWRPSPANHPLHQRPKISAPAGFVPPVTVDLRSQFLPVRDQGKEGACSGFSTAALREQAHAAANGGTPISGYLSPAYLYARTRMLEGSFPQDSGATIADEISTLENYGVCPESFMPYNQDPSEPLDPGDDVAAAPFRIPAASPVSIDKLSLQSVLASGAAIVIGFEVHESFENPGPDANGVVPVPAPGEALLGGHGVLIVGYTLGGWLVRNQWGAGWGLGGYFIGAWGFESLIQEAWTISPITSP